MDISRELITQFFKGACTAEEAAAVSDYLTQHPEEAAEWLPEKEWALAEGTAGRPEEYWQKIWQGIKPARTVSIWRLVRNVAAAAILVGALAMAGYWLIAGREKMPQAAEGFIVTNTSGEIMRHTLEDGSVAELYPGASLRYDPAFAGGRRDVHLAGEAVFHTTGDAARPFSVLGNGIATTALGTTFRVTAPQGSGNTSVTLLEGKVIVASADTTLARLDTTYILLPGDEFNYSPENGIALRRKQPARPQPARKNAAMPEDDSPVNSWYMFENQGLEQVFEQLAAIYNVRIYYDPADLKGLNFIGKIDQADSLENILRDIAMLNNLNVMKNKKDYVIKAPRN
ncbi:FecR family protein [Chitinophaga alhagiae]|uniref:FecR family protein n=1 Tax=Chitinophaga alhagiae TaxID=2203219 RepID=UPI0018E536B9|nr:FecR family protein [Chitinophaga alhagiae]